MLEMRQCKIGFICWACHVGWISNLHRWHGTLSPRNALMWRKRLLRCPPQGSVFWATYIGTCNVILRNLWQLLCQLLLYRTRVSSCEMVQKRDRLSLSFLPKNEWKCHHKKFPFLQILSWLVLDLVIICLRKVATLCKKKKKTSLKLHSCMVYRHHSPSDIFCQMANFTPCEICAVAPPTPEVGVTQPLPQQVCIEKLCAIERLSLHHAYGIWETACAPVSHMDLWGIDTHAQHF